MNEEKGFPTTIEYYKHLSMLREIKKATENKDNVIELSKKLPFLNDKELDSFLKEFNQTSNQRVPHFDASEVISKVEMVPNSPSEKFIYNWRHRMYTEGIDISQGIDVVSTTINGLPVFIYKPTLNVKAAPGAIVYYHGGGFIGGSIKVTEGFIKLLAQYTGNMVFSIDYPYAPEYKADQTIEESYNTLIEIFNSANSWGFDRSNFSILGESSGANLALSVVQKDIINQTSSIKNVMIGYPIVTLDLKQGERLKNTQASGKEVGAGDKPFSEVTSIIGGAYLPKDFSKTDPLISPINMSQDILERFPRTFIITDEMDPLRYHGRFFAHLLGKNKVKVNHLYYSNIPHAFLNYSGILPHVQDCAITISHWLNGKNLGEE